MLLNKQEEELSQMVQLQATLARLTVRTHDIQVRREETRHKLLEARHLVELLLIEENDFNLAHEEVEADLVKPKAHEQGLARLVSSRCSIYLLYLSGAELERRAASCAPAMP
jgi:hypothetical protein